ncbi:hypothetical protein LCGC14_0744010 [marine sediment metagenome]|uniref:Uncharacterized protein n=1 Tax=marine sediment metagenome TaxID=412755 RepID=A0A0F9QQZ0_9ZZZZ
MSFKDEKPNRIEVDHKTGLYDADKMDKYLAIVEPKAENWDKFFEKPEARVKAVELLLENGKKLEAIKIQVIEPQLKDSKEYLDAHKKPEPHDVVMSRYWLEKGIHGTVSEIKKIMEAS